jgi:hypothetical protein
MTDDAGNNSFRGRGLFAKYVFSLVGLVLFVLAVNSAIETYFIYRETQSSLVNAMAEKADATSAARTICCCCGRCPPSARFSRSTATAASSCA